MTPLLTTKHAAALLCLSEDRIRRYAAAGALPCIRINARTIRFRQDALEKWIAKKESK